MSLSKRAFAEFIGTFTDSNSATTAGVVLGTASYMSPEV